MAIRSPWEKRRPDGVAWTKARRGNPQTIIPAPAFNPAGAHLRLSAPAPSVVIDPGVYVAYAMQNPAQATGTGRPVRSTDGDTWTPFTPPVSGFGWFDAVRGLTGLWLQSSGTGVWRTADAGDTWTPLTALPLAHRGGSLIVRGSGVLLVTAATQSGNITVLRSPNGGATWDQITVDVAANFVGVGFIPWGQHLWETASGAILLAVVDPHTSNNQPGARVYRSTDGGATWTLVFAPSFPRNQIQRPVTMGLTVRGDIAWCWAWNPLFPDTKLFRSASSGASGTWGEVLPFGAPTDKGGWAAGDMGGDQGAGGQNPILMPNDTWLCLLDGSVGADPSVGHQSRTTNLMDFTQEVNADTHIRPVGGASRLSGIAYVSKHTGANVLRSSNQGVSWASDAQFAFRPHAWFFPDPLLPP